MTRALVWTLVVWTLPAVAAADWRDTLKLPLSPGSVALLVEHGSEPDVRGYWQKALASDNARVRATAARMRRPTGFALADVDLCRSKSGYEALAGIA